MPRIHTTKIRTGNILGIAPAVMITMIWSALKATPVIISLWWRRVIEMPTPDINLIQRYIIPCKCAIKISARSLIKCRQSKQAIGSSEPFVDGTFTTKVFIEGWESKDLRLQLNTQEFVADKCEKAIFFSSTEPTIKQPASNIPFLCNHISLLKATQ